MQSASVLLRKTLFTLNTRHYPQIIANNVGIRADLSLQHGSKEIQKYIEKLSNASWRKSKAVVWRNPNRNKFFLKHLRIAGNWSVKTLQRKVSRV